MAQIAQILVSYSEWLDSSENLMLIQGDDDKRSHEGLVAEFLQRIDAGEWMPTPDGDTEPVEGDADHPNPPSTIAVEVLTEIAESKSTLPSVRIQAATALLNWTS